MSTNAMPSSAIALIYFKRLLPYLMTVAVSIGGAYYVIEHYMPKPKPAKEIVTIDLRALVEDRVDKLLASTGNNDSIVTEQEAYAIVTTKINKQLALLADEAQVVIMPSNAVIAGSEKNITTLIEEMK